MARMAKRMRETLPPRRVRPGRLRIPPSRDLGKCSRPESPRAAQPEPPRLPPPARGPEEVSLRRGKFSAVDVSGLGARSEATAGFAGRNSRPHGSRSNDREEPKSLRGNRLYGVAHESGGRAILAASAISREVGGENVSSADLARGFARGKRFTFHGTRAARRMGLVRDAGFSPCPPDGAVVLAIV